MPATAYDASMSVVERGRRPVAVTTVTGRGAEGRGDVLAVEEPLQIRLAAEGQVRDVAITMRTPGDDQVLALGYLVSEGIVADVADVIDLTFCLSDVAEPDRGGEALQHRNVVTAVLKTGMPALDAQLRYGTMTSACGVCGRATLEALDERGLGRVPSGPRLPLRVLGQLPRRLRAAQEVFDQTGGLHAAARFDAAGGLLDAREDVGRHNALDKLVGASALEGTLPWADQVLVLSGRASYELLQKAVVAGVGLVAAIGAPSSLAVDVADRFGVTLVGFLRENRANVYTHPARILDDTIDEVSGVAR